MPILILPIQGPTYQEIILGTTSATLVGYWPFDVDGSDVSGNSYNLAPQGGVPPTIIPGGQVNSATSMVFNPGTRWLGNHAFPAGFWDSWSAEAWVRIADTLTTTIRWLFQVNTGGGSGQFAMRIDAPGVGLNPGIRADHRGTTAGIQGSIAFNQWTHVVVTHPLGGPFNHYINGANVGGPLGGSAVTTLASAEISLGNSFGGSGFGFDGDVDEATLWQGVLSPADILAHYNAGLAA